MRTPTPCTFCTLEHRPFLAKIKAEFALVIRGDGWSDATHEHDVAEGDAHWGTEVSIHRKRHLCTKSWRRLSQYPGTRVLMCAGACAYGCVLCVLLFNHCAWLCEYRQIECRFPCFSRVTEPTKLSMRTRFINIDIAAKNIPNLPGNSEWGEWAVVP